MLFIITLILLASSHAYSCDVELNCNNVTYLMICETSTLPEPPQKGRPVYAVVIFLTKKMFDFNQIAAKCKNEDINIYAKGVYIHGINIDKFVSGGFAIVRDEKEQAFNVARTICREKTDPDLRR